ncbi:MAG: phosphotransferase [Campylobacterota bacterium]
MGVKTIISLNDIRPYINAKKLTPTIDGIMDSVYIIDDSFVLKVFENMSSEAVKEELELLKSCEGLNIPKVVSQVITIQNKPALIYEKCKGQSLKKATVDEIVQIGKFLKSFHDITKNKQSNNMELFARNRLYEMICDTKHHPFLECFNSLDIELKNDGIIHGDLFLDNASFYHGKLSCVYDFTQSCNGDFLFDLGVVGLSWCEGIEDKKALLRGYKSDISMDIFDKYIKYAGLFYSVNRFSNNRNFKDLWEKIND